MTLMKRADDADVEKKYETIADLPEAVRGALPEAAQRQFMAVANSALSGGAREESAFAQAWGALKNSGWKKGDAGKWIKKDYADGPSYFAPAAVAQEVQALDFDDVLAADEAIQATYQIKDEVWRHWNALQRSFETIAADADVAAADKVAAMRASLTQFIASLDEESRDAITKCITAVPALAGLLQKSEEGDDDMTAAEKQQLDELQETVEKLTKSLAAATDKDPAKKAADLAGELETAKAKIAELTEKAAGGDAERAEAVAKAGMSDAEKTYMASLSGADKMKFMQATPADRAKMMKKSADEDEIVKVGDREIRKSVVGDDQFAVIKSQQDEIAKQAERLAKAEEARETAELSKRADDVLKAFSGETAEKVGVLRAMSRMGEKDRLALEKMLEVGGKAIAAAFEKIGHSREDARKSAADFNKRVDEIAARDKIGKSAAMSRARVEYPDEFAAFQEAGQPVAN